VTAVSRRHRPRVDGRIDKYKYRPGPPRTRWCRSRPGRAAPRRAGRSRTGRDRHRTDPWRCMPGQIVGQLGRTLRTDDADIKFGPIVRTRFSETRRCGCGCLECRPRLPQEIAATFGVSFLAAPNLGDNQRKGPFQRPVGWRVNISGRKFFSEGRNRDLSKTFPSCPRSISSPRPISGRVGRGATPVCRPPGNPGSFFSGSARSRRPATAKRLRFESGSNFL
jgi:hypothetical protein